MTDPGKIETKGTRSMPVRSYGIYVMGAEVNAHGTNAIEVLNPANGDVWATIADAGPAEVDMAVQAAREAFRGPWSGIPPSQRVRLLGRLADVIEERGEELARLEVRDNGKLLREMSAQLFALPKWYRYFAGLADKIQGDTIPMDAPSLFNYTRREPVGVIACVTPWNSPLLLGTWKFAPALAAGNTIVVKPSEHASISTLEFAKCFEAAGFPPGVFNVVTGLGSTAGKALVSHPDVGRVCFTGSGEAGSRVATDAVSHFASVSLELGGKSPNIVFADAPMEAAVAGLLAGIFAAGGQTCVAGSRALIQRGIHEQVVERLIGRVKRIRLGDPMNPETEMGPIANPPQLAKVESYVAIGRQEGAELVVGGSRPDDDSLRDGLYFEPTIFDRATNHMAIAQQEIFGPVLTIIPFDDENEAIAIANETPYGLAAGVWTSDVGRAHRVARLLEAGTVWINTYRAVAPAMPFGGYKASGIGRENGLDSVFDFTRVKSVWIETEPAVADPFSIRV